MSLILEALRKSEAERRRGQAPDLLQAEPAGPAAAATRVPAWAWGGALLALLALSLLWPRDATHAPTTAVGAPATVPATPALRTPAPAMDAGPVATLPPVPHLRPAPAPAPVPAAATPAPPDPPAAADTATRVAATPVPPAATTPVSLRALPAAARKALPPLRLSMHLWNADPARRVAVLDGQRVAEGDRIGDGVVTAITREGVILDWNGARILVPLP